jgi:hypothetical protein
LVNYKVLYRSFAEAEQIIITIMMTQAGINWQVISSLALAASACKVALCAQSASSTCEKKTSICERGMNVPESQTPLEVKFSGTLELSSVLQGFEARRLFKISGNIFEIPKVQLKSNLLNSKF